ncbi:amidase [Dictyobacter arantiisoli]|uniref:Amidase n=1 Tax=Dictyobacter arantiisoli TaxID=2014874 RepID=A0A5A5TDU8_9CHLR|nr:amidase [Dictyobacter arantiisoli]GCF09487.1 amidase [Dictyobacter arantiisoli]
MHLKEATIAELQAAMSQGHLTARQLTESYLKRIHSIDQHGPTLNSIIELNPDALTIATALDEERALQGSRGPLHGIPIILKDNIATADAMQTTAGSLALVGSRPPRDAFVVQKLRAAGAVILGKSNLSEWANFRGNPSISGWSGRGGQTHNPYVLDRTPCGSSSGSAVAVAANLTSVSLGTETDGSIICPASMTDIVGIKPTVGLTSRAGVIPIAHSQDSVGPMARTVADAALVLGIITGMDDRDAATRESATHLQTDYTQFLDADGLRGARIGVTRSVYFGYSHKADALIESALTQLASQGAILIDPADIITAQQMAKSEVENQVLLYELKADLNKYLSELTDSSVHTLADIITFNLEHADQELQLFGQEQLIQAQATSGLDNTIYQAALASSRQLSRQAGIDAIMDKYQLDALVMPSCSPAWHIDPVNGDHYSGSSTQAAAMAGYPAISVPAGHVQGLPVGITFTGRAYSEPTLIKLAYAFEQATKARREPTYLPTIQ